MTDENEKQLLVLLSIEELGGSATKRCVLDRIDLHGYAILTDSDRQFMESRSEARWRNNFAFVRKHLVQNGSLSGLVKDEWRITDRGRQRLVRLAKEAEASYCRRIISDAGLLALRRFTIDRL